MFRYLVLGLLKTGGAHHGYALMKAYRDRSGISISTGNFYRELARLVREGLVRTAHRPPDADPRRAPYQITPAGIAAFDAWLAAPSTGATGAYEDELSARLLFVGGAEPEVAQRLLERWREEVWLRGKTLERDRDAALAREHADGGRFPFDPLALLLWRRMKHVAADLEFVQEYRATYERWLAARPKARPATVRAVTRRVDERAPRAHTRSAR